MKEVERELNRAVIAVIDFYLFTILMMREAQRLLTEFTIHENTR
jgi:hypothetical protein